MAARTNKRLHSERDKLRIRASQLLNRLESFANGKVELSAAQVQAARIMIGKVVPDLKSVEVTGDPERPRVHSLTVEFVNPHEEPNSPSTGTPPRTRVHSESRGALAPLR